MDPSSSFHTKTYRQLDPATISKALDPDIWMNKDSHDATSPRKKIVASPSLSGLREEFKKTFLPLLIDIFELRQMIENYKSYKLSNRVFHCSPNSKSPQEILEHLAELQGDIEEAQRWCDGVIMQISRGIQEAKEALQPLGEKEENFDNPNPLISTPKAPLWKKLYRFLHKRKL